MKGIFLILQQPSKWRLTENHMKRAFQFIYTLTRLSLSYYLPSRIPPLLLAKILMLLNRPLASTLREYPMNTLRVATGCKTAFHYSASKLHHGFNFDLNNSIMEGKGEKLVQGSR